jgi:hypothetical protein
MKNHNIEEVPGFDFVDFSNREEIWANDQFCERMNRVHKGISGLAEFERAKESLRLEVSRCVGTAQTCRMKEYDQHVAALRKAAKDKADAEAKAAKLAKDKADAEAKASRGSDSLT